jgi:thioredoxin-related protein
MKFRIILLQIIFLMMTATGLFPGTVEWNDFNSGIKISKQTNKPILIFFYTPWCHWCNVMNKDTYTNAGVISRLKNSFVSVGVNLASNDTINFEGKSYSVQSFSNIFGVMGVPTIIFMNKNGETITKIPGYIKTDLFIPLLDYISSECYKKKVSFSDYIDGKKGNCR